MADTRKITIEIVQRDEGSATPQPTQVQVDSNNESQTKASSEGKLLLKSVILNQGYNTAKRLVIQGVEANINNYFSLTEDYMAENTYTMIKSSISKITSAGSAVLSGAMAGSVAGPVGAGIGAVIGAVGFGVSEFFGFQTRMSGYYRALNSSAIEKDYFSRRAGLVDDGKGTEN